MSGTDQFGADLAAAPPFHARKMPCTELRQHQNKFARDVLVRDPKADPGPADIHDLAGLQAEGTFRSNPGIIGVTAAARAAIVMFLEFGAQFRPKTKSQVLL